MSARAPTIKPLAKSPRRAFWPALTLALLAHGVFDAGFEPLRAVSSLTAFAAVLIFVFVLFTRPDTVPAAPGAALAG
jgi:hypothetical protein